MNGCSYGGWFRARGLLDEWMSGNAEGPSAHKLMFSTRSKSQCRAIGFPPKRQHRRALAHQFCQPTCAWAGASRLAGAERERSARWARAAPWGRLAAGCWEIARLTRSLATTLRMGGRHRLAGRERSARWSARGARATPGGPICCGLLADRPTNEEPRCDGGGVSQGGGGAKRRADRCGGCAERQADHCETCATRGRRPRGWRSCGRVELPGQGETSGAFGKASLSKGGNTAEIGQAIRLQWVASPVPRPQAQLGCP